VVLDNLSDTEDRSPELRDPGALYPLRDYRHPAGNFHDCSPERYHRGGTTGFTILIFVLEAQSKKIA
jgi:hypothetical protein